MLKEELVKFLTEPNKLDHGLPSEVWESYLLAIIKINNDENISSLKKTVRLQKAMRYIYDNEVKKFVVRFKKSEEENKKLRNIKTSIHYFSKDVCQNCSHYQTTNVYGHDSQLITGPCMDCYGDRLFIIKNFKELSSNKENNNEKQL
jgi:hypothetical protein